MQLINLILMANIFAKYYKNSKRLLFRSTRRPSKKEYWATARITAIGLLAIGLIGWLVNIIITVAIDGTIS